MTEKTLFDPPRGYHDVRPGERYRNPVTGTVWRVLHLRPRLHLAPAQDRFTVVRGRQRRVGARATCSTAWSSFDRPQRHRGESRPHRPLAGPTSGRALRGRDDDGSDDGSTPDTAADRRRAGHDAPLRVGGAPTASARGGRLP